MPYVTARKFNFFKKKGYYLRLQQQLKGEHIQQHKLVKLLLNISGEKICALKKFILKFYDCK